MPPNNRLTFLAPWLVLFAFSSWAGQTLLAGDPREDLDFFESRVRPVLAAHCFSCHGPKKQESNLRLDSRELMLKGGDGGEVVEAGHPDRSRLVEAIRWTGELKMPPETKLRDDQIEALTQWVARGMAWPSDSTKPSSADPGRGSWAFKPVRKAALPAVSAERWSRTPIDCFVLAELGKHGLTPSVEADRRTLIRRATFDLHGLPPTPEDIENFVSDRAVDAYERLVDRLLASPNYGERWGRHWLDVARYADTKGYVFFEEKKYPWAYTYRDYVIDALNRDLPYDRFVTEQLAADQLDLGDDKRPLTALGFLTVGSHFMNNTHDIIDDRIDVVTRGLLGVTVTCSRCHDHKYDPITMSDYYALYGVFRSCYEPIVPPQFRPAPDTEEYHKFAAEMSTREKKLVDFVTQKHAELVSGARTRVGEYLWAAYQLRDHPPTDDFMLLVDKGDLNPTMILRWQVYLSSHQNQADPVWAPWHALASLSGDSFASQAKVVLEKLLNSTGESQGINRLVREMLQRAPPTTMQEIAERYGGLMKEIDQQWQAALKTAADAHQPALQCLEDPAAEELRQVLYAENSPPDVPLAMDWGFLSLFPDRPTQGEYEKLLKEVEQWMMTGAAAPPRAMVLWDDPRLYQPRIFLRGNPNQLGDVVPRRFITALSTEARPFQQGSGRRELAQAIVDPANPLTARVQVNRLWLHHFGQGLVRTPSDFGLRSEPPSHPELLDWLAAELIEHGWSLKSLHREIMLSAVYRQAADFPFGFQVSDFRLDQSAKQIASRGTDSPKSEIRNPNGESEIDPENRLLWRFPRRRLEFEAMRDAMLAVADNLEMRLGGSAVDLLGDTLVPRRTVYGTVDRMDVPTLLTTFDFPNPLTTSSQRTATTVAPQALYAMNNALVAEIARRMIARPDVASLSDSGQRVARLFQLCFGREPTATERLDAEELIGPQPSDAQWQQLAHALLMSNEFLFVD